MVQVVDSNSSSAFAHNEQTAVVCVVGVFGIGPSIDVLVRPRDF